MVPFSELCRGDYRSPGEKFFKLGVVSCQSAPTLSGTSSAGHRFKSGRRLHKHFDLLRSRIGWPLAPGAGPFVIGEHPPDPGSWNFLSDFDAHLLLFRAPIRSIAPLFAKDSPPCEPPSQAQCLPRRRGNTVAEWSRRSERIPSEGLNTRALIAWSSSRSIWIWFSSALVNSRVGIEKPCATPMAGSDSADQPKARA